MAKVKQTGQKWKNQFRRRNTLINNSKKTDPNSKRQQRVDLTCYDVKGKVATIDGESQQVKQTNPPKFSK